MEKLRILVVDDEPDVETLFRQKFRRQIKRGDYEMTFATSASEALDFIHSNGAENLTMVLSDINMPGMDGLELLKIIKGESRELKVIMVTAYGDDNNYKQAQELGADEFLTKPVNFNQLQEKIEGIS